MNPYSREPDRQELTRREAIAAALAAAAGGLTLATGANAAPPQGIGARKGTPAPAPFKFGLQSYSLRGYKKEGKTDTDKALQVTKQLGLNYWEAFPQHFPMITDTAGIAQYKKRAADQGVTVLGYGVVPFTKDHDKNRTFFEFAKAMGLRYLSADPKPEAFDSLDKLVEEYGVAVGIHNHGPGHHYAKIDTIAETIKNHHKLIGCCVDTGHFLRSSEDPVRAVETFGRRTYGVHLKDVKDATRFTVLGKGDLRTGDLLKALAAVHYDYLVAIEYEESEENPVHDIEECLAALHATNASPARGARPARLRGRAVDE
jgi:sugar phosphate isomerase/epimerase